MNNNTLEDLYKKAVIKQYKEVKDGEDYIYLNAPTRGKLNKLCWEIFETKPVSTDDKVVFNTLLGFPFDLNTKNKFRSNTNQFRPIETFLKGETDPDKIEVVDLAAILVDFQLRPFNKFRRQIDPEDLELINELRDTNFIKEKISSDNQIAEIAMDSTIDAEKDFVVEEEPDQFQSEELEEFEADQYQEPESIFVNTKEKTKFKNLRYLIMIFVFTGLCIGISLALRKKDCMLWAGDHYELKSKSEEGYCDSYYDARYFNLKKITVCDTTTFFDNNGRAKVWYFKVSPKSIECFDRYAPYPLNTNRNLKPITQYMIDTYLADRPKCK